MRMAWGIFFGILIILFGVNILVNIIFHIQIPFFKILIGLFFVFLGIKIIVGGNWPFKQCNSDKEVIFGEASFTGVPEKGEYTALFSKAQIDLTQVELIGKITKVKVATVFGSSQVKLDKKMPVMVQADAVFGNVTMPNQNAAGFGSTVWNSDSFNANDKYLLIDADAVFGSIEIGYQ